MRKPSSCTQNIPLRIMIHISFTVQARYSSFVNCIRYSMNYCINGGNFIKLLLLFIKLFKFEIQKHSEILRAHKPYFLMPGHICYKGFCYNLSYVYTYDTNQPQLNRMQHVCTMITYASHVAISKLWVICTIHIIIM